MEAAPRVVLEPRNDQLAGPQPVPVVEPYKQNCCIDRCSDPLEGRVGHLAEIYVPGLASESLLEWRPRGLEPHLADVPRPARRLVRQGRDPVVSFPAVRDCFVIDREGYVAEGGCGSRPVLGDLADVYLHTDIMLIGVPTFQ